MNVEMPGAAGAARDQAASPAEAAAEVVVIGGGPAGLAAAACLKMHGISSVVLEKGDHPAYAWHNHYERLHLNSTKGLSYLPGLKMPAHYPRYPSRNQVIEYMDAYARKFEVNLVTGQQVRALERDAGGWTVVTGDRRWRGRCVVVATGRYSRPWSPRFPGQESFRGTLLHSGEYRNAKPFAGQRVVLVGAGDAGTEIACDLLGVASSVTLVIRSGVRLVPRQALGIPAQYLARFVMAWPRRLQEPLAGVLAQLIMGDIRKWGLPLADYGYMDEHRIPVIEHGFLAEVKRRAFTILRGQTTFCETGLLLDGTQHVPADAVILATGFVPELEFLKGWATLDPQGIPLRDDQVRSREHQDLYYVGYQLTRLGTLYSIGQHAMRVAQSISGQKRLAAPRAAP